MAARFCEIRHRQLRRSIRRQKLVVLALNVQLWRRPWRLVPVPQATKAIYQVEAGRPVKAFVPRAVPRAILLRLRKPAQFTILSIAGTDWIVIEPGEYGAKAPCGKLRTGPARIVRIKRSELSRARK